MKTKKLFILASISLFGLMMVATGCDKKDDPAPAPTPAPVVLTNTQKLCDKNFKLTASTVSPAYPYGGTLITDFYAQYSACSTDNIYRFNTNGTFSYDEGPSLCNVGDPQTYTGTWVFGNNETKLTITFTGNPGDTYDILQNDGNILKLTYTAIESGITYTITDTYTKQ